jgi:protease I
MAKHSAQQPEGAQELSGLSVAILVDDLFEQVELTGPRQALQEAGVKTTIVSPREGPVHGMHHDQRGDAFPVDLPLERADPQAFDAVLLPGGTFNADTLRTNEQAQRFVRAFDDARKPVAVICHGAWLLVSAGLVEGRMLTSWPSLQDDIRNAGGTWLDREVVVDTNWVSSRKPDDLPAFQRELLAALAAAPELRPSPMPITE